MAFSLLETLRGSFLREKEPEEALQSTVAESLNALVEQTMYDVAMRAGAAGAAVAEAAAAAKQKLDGRSKEAREA